MHKLRHPVVFDEVFLCVSVDVHEGVQQENVWRGSLSVRVSARGHRAREARGRENTWADWITHIPFRHVRCRRRPRKNVAGYTGRSSVLEIEGGWGLRLVVER